VYYKDGDKYADDEEKINDNYILLMRKDLNLLMKKKMNELLA
jgi:hypothetical protein